MNYTLKYLKVLVQLYLAKRSLVPRYALLSTSNIVPVPYDLIPDAVGHKILNSDEFPKKGERTVVPFSSVSVSSPLAGMFGAPTIEPLIGSQVDAKTSAAPVPESPVAVTSDASIRQILLLL